MGKPSEAENAILLATSNDAVADYLLKRGLKAKEGGWSAISEETEAALLARSDRLIDLRLAEYCLFPATAHALFHRDSDDWPLRSLVLSNEAVAHGMGWSPMPECIFGGKDGLKGYLTAVTPDDAGVLFTNPTLDDGFLEDVLGLGEYWQVMPEHARRVALSSLGFNSKMHQSVDMADHPDGFGWYMAGQPFHAAWRLVIELEVTADNARHLAVLYDHLTRYCLQRDGVLEALPRWMPQSQVEQEKEETDNKRGYFSDYQNIRRAATAMLLGGYELKQDELLQSSDIAVRCGTYAAGKFSPAEMGAAIERDGWFATASLMCNPLCWRTADHRNFLHDGLGSSDDETRFWEYRRWSDKFAKENPEWFEIEEVSLDLEPDRSLTEISIGELTRHVVSSSAFTALAANIEKVVQAQKMQFWLMVALLVLLLFRP